VITEISSHNHARKRSEKQTKNNLQLKAPAAAKQNKINGTAKYYRQIN
jgi:hypothetical protein